MVSSTFQKLSFLVLFTLFVTSTWFTQDHCAIKEVQANPSMLPSDGDAWTENDNATYTWKFHPSYKINETMSWTTSDVKEGSYALNVTHTGTGTAIYFRVVLDQDYDVSDYDLIFFWFKPTSPDSSYTFCLYMHSTDTNWDVTNYLKTPTQCNPNYNNNTWVRMVMPLVLFDTYGTATPTQIRQVYFQFNGISSADGSRFLVDNLHFGDYSVDTQTPTVDQTKMMPLAWHALEFSQFTQKYGGLDYISMYNFQNITSPYTNSTGALETEVLGHTIFALCWAYDKTKFDFYLDEAETLATWLLQFQEEHGNGAGGFYTYWTGVAFGNTLNTITNGWVLAGLSYLYDLTGDSSYRTASDDLKDYLTGIMWNSTNEIWNLEFNNGTQTVSYGTSYSGMREGAVTTGLMSYYMHVSNDANAKTQVDTVLSNRLNTVDPWGYRKVFETAKLEDNNYQLWGVYMSYQALGNITYRDAFLDTTKMLITKYMQSPSLNGSQNTAIGLPYAWAKGSGDYLNDWGSHVGLPLFFLANEMEPHDYFVNFVERCLFNYTRRIQNSQGAVRRDNNIYVDRQYCGTPSFIVLASQFYHLNKDTDRYIAASDGKITAISQTDKTLHFTLSGTGMSTSYVYCDDKGEPISIFTVNGTLTWSYDAFTGILTLNVTHESPTGILVYWKFPGEVNSDGIVDIVDLALMGKACGATLGSPNWDEGCDINGDEITDYYDLAIFGENYGKSQGQ